MAGDKKFPKDSGKKFKTKVSSNGFERSVTFGPRKKKTTAKKGKK